MNTDDDLVTSAWIARRVGVGRAAVANWRKRYPEFPAPAADGPLFSWSDVQRWLAQTGKADQLATYGRTGTGTHRIGDAAAADLTRDLDLASLPPRDLLARVMVSLLPRLPEADYLMDDDAPAVLDPACRDATLLRALAERFGDHVRLAGQVPAGASVRAVRTRLAEPADLREGNALDHDRFTDLGPTAWAVVCLPPTARQWPAGELAADPRWRYGLPDANHPELAWAQHCLAHLQARGVAVVATSTINAVRPSGRHIRAALVRAGVLRDVIALPEKLTPTGEGTLYLWVLTRGHAGGGVRMVDLAPLADRADVPSSHAGWELLFATEDPAVVRVVPPLELLDGDVPLVPSRYLQPRAGDSAADLTACTDRLARLYARVGQALPKPVATTVRPRHAEVTLAELERSRAISVLSREATPRKGDLLFRTLGRAPVVATGTPDDEQGIAQVVEVDPDRLDPHFLAMFVRADALAAPVGNTSASLTRDDVRRCRVPRLTLAEQRRYGDAYRHLQEVEAITSRLATLTQAVVAQSVHGLTTGALSPSQRPIL